MNLYPSERKTISKICNEETTRLSHERTHKLTALEDFSKRVMDRLYQAGFIAVIDTDPLNPKNYDLVGDDTLVYCPTVDIVERVAKEHETDFDKMQFEVKTDLGYELAHDGEKKAFE